MAVWSIHPGWEHGRPHCPAGRFANRIWEEYSIGLAGPGHHKQGGGKRVAEGEHRHHHHRHCYQIATNIVVITMMQVNSLAHYGVKEKALVSLVPKQIDSPSHHIYQVSQM